jgi:hypothetical protein
VNLIFESLHGVKLTVERLLFDVNLVFDSGSVGVALIVERLLNAYWCESDFRRPTCCDADS